ncbi:MAG: hypothetical protein KA347_10275 [Bacteroidia bacterium]|jgi:hypothetical protein|nr:hypothetical protein [Bacteroidia bacterium]MBP7245977.1 hypothetical protein [Bacteroidia bacterium]
MKNKMIRSTALPVVIYFILMGLNIINVNAAGYSCSPSKVNLHANFGSVTIFIMGDSVNQLNEYAFFKDDKLVKEIVVTRMASSKNADDRLTILVQVINRNLTDGSYKLKGNLKANKSIYITLPLDIKIDKYIPIKKPEPKLAPFIQLGKYAALNVNRALVASNKPTNGFVFTPGQSVLNDPAVRRNLMLDALAEEIAAGLPKVKDWFPKTTGAQSGTLVIAGENLELIGEVRIGQVTLMPIQPTEYSTNFNANKTRVYKLPEGPIQGNLVWKRSGSSIYIPIENNYRTVMESSQDWPAMRTTYLGAANVYTGEGESVNNTLNRGRGDAMRLIQYTFLVEYIPGNIINVAYFPNDIPKLGVKGGEVISHVNAYSFADASGNKGVFGNALVVSFQKYVRDVDPSVNFEMRTLPCSIKVESYVNTASVQNISFNRFAVLNLEYNALKKYTIDRTNTSSVERLFAFQNTFAWGQVSGESRNLNGANSIDVGRVTVDGDIAIRIASGPLGTNGIWLSPALLMPHGWLVDGIGWSEKREYSNSQIMAYSSETEYNGIPTLQNNVSMIGLYQPFCGGSGTRYNPGLGKGANLINNVPKIMGYDGKSLSFGIKPVVLDATYSHLCNIKGPVSNEPTSGQFVKGAVISLAADSYIDNSVRVLMKLDYLNFLGPHDADLNYMLSKIYLYDSNSFEPSSSDGGLVSRPTPYPPSQLERYRAFPVDYYMFAE